MIPREAAAVDAQCRVELGVGLAELEAGASVRDAELVAVFLRRLELAREAALLASLLYVPGVQA